MKKKEKTDMYRYHMEDELYKCESIENELIEREHQKHLGLLIFKRKSKQREQVIIGINPIEKELIMKEYQKEENRGAAPDKNEKSLVQRMDEAVTRRDQMLDKLDNIQNRLKRMKELEDMMRQNYHYQEGLYWSDEW